MLSLHRLRARAYKRLNIPSTITAGDYVAWTDPPGRRADGSAIDSSTWTLVYSLRTNAAAQGATVTGTADGAGGWNFVISTSTSTGFAAGAWAWAARATSGAQVVTLGTGSLQVLPSLAYSGTPAAFDKRSQAEKDLEAVQSAIRTIISGGVSQYMVGSRQATKLDLGRLMKREKDLQGIVARERAAEKMAAGLGDPRSLFVRFGS